MTFSPYPNYKDSRIGFIGEIPSHWIEKRAKYFFKEIDERSVTGDEEMLSVSHITGVTPRSQKNVNMFKAETNVGMKICAPGDVVINTMWAWMSALGVSSHFGIVSPSYGVYRPLDSEIYINSYLDHLLRAEGYRSEYICRSTGIRSSRLRLYPDKFLSMHLICPPLDEQRKIAKYIQVYQTIFKKFIREKKAFIEVLREQKQIIISKAVTEGINLTGKYKSSGVEWVGSIPEDWSVYPLKHIAYADNSGSYGFEPEECEIKMPVATTAQIDNDGKFQVNKMPIRSFTSDDVKNYICKPGEILVVKSSGSISNVITGKVGIITDETPDFIFSNFLMRLTPNEERVLPLYLFYLLTSHLTRERVKRMVSGSTYPNLRTNEYLSAKFPVPPLDQQVKCCDFIKDKTIAIDNAISRAKSEMELVREYWNKLISDVVTGKIDVREVELTESIDEVADNFYEDNEGCSDISVTEDTSDEDN